MAKTKFQILRKEGFILNTSDKIVNGVLKGLDRCGGKCPCYHKEEGDETPDEDLICPCKEYRENDHCRCNLYIKETKQESNKELEHELEMSKNAYASLLQKYKNLQLQIENTENAENLVY